MTEAFPFSRRYAEQIGRHRSPERDDIHARYYPLRGLYSSRHPETARAQLTELKDAGANVVVLSWWGQGGDGKESADSQGVQTDAVVPVILAAAEAVGSIKVAFHLEPYPGKLNRMSAASPEPWHDVP